MKWKPISEAPPNKWLLVRGLSGYVHVKHYYCLAREVPEYRPPIEGRRRFITTSNDSVTDGYPYPTEFVTLKEFEEWGNE